MVKVFAFIPKRSDVSESFFHDHWAGPHAEHAQRITTIRRYVQSHRIGVEVPVLPSAAYDGIAEVWFDDAATAAGMGEDPNYVDYAHADEPNFIDTNRLAFVTGTEHWLSTGQAEAAAVKAMLLLRRSSRTTPEDFAERVASLPPFDGMSAGACITLAIPESYAADAEPTFDAVAELVYRNEGELAKAGAELRQLVDDQLGSAVEQAASAALVARELRVVWPGVSTPS